MKGGPSGGWGRSQNLARMVSLLAFLALWAFAAEVFGARTLPGPAAVFAVARHEWADGALPAALAATLCRVVAAFGLAMGLGTILGYAMGRWRRLDHFADAWLILLINIPALVIIILAYVWFGLTEGAAIGAVALTKLPTVITMVREGVRVLDPGLAAMARVYRFDRWTVISAVVLPQLQPYLAAAARNGLSLVWKIVLVVELLGRPNGVGFELHSRFQLFDVAGLLAYALTFSAVMLALEFGVLQPYETHARRWRVRSA